MGPSLEMIEFFKVIEDGHAPEKADASANGTLPTNGFRYCEPVRAASGFGWYVYLPLELGLVWDGHEYEWSVDGFENSYFLNDAIQYPGFSDAFDAHAPEGLKGYAPPFVSRTNDPDILQIWTGLFVRTKADIGVWVRSPVNLQLGHGYLPVEGVVETSWWYGPLFSNVRIHARNTPVVIRKSLPFLQLLPFSKPLQEAFGKSKPVVTSGLEKLSAAEWDAYEKTVVRRMKHRTGPGQYAVEARKRAKSGA